MNFIRWISGKFGGDARAGQKSRLKIENLTRQCVLGHSVEVADRAGSRNKGLLGRGSLPAGGGLWIVPCASIHTFGMRFAIDLVYLDRKKVVRKVRRGVAPWRVSACLSAHSVIELPTGTIQATQTQAGDLLEFSPICTAGN